MSRNKKIVMYICFGLLFLSGIIIYTTTSPVGGVVVIKSDGMVIETVNLESVTSDYELTAKNQGYNVIKITRNGVKVTEADCPDKLCIKQSEKGIYPIICLPHKLVIEKSKQNHKR